MTKAMGWVLAIFAIAAAIALAVYGARERSTALARLETLERENRDLRARLSSPAPTAPTTNQPLQEPAAPPRPQEKSAAPGVDPAVVQRLQSELAEARAATQRAEGRQHEFEEYSQKLREEVKRLAAAETELNEKTADLNRVVAALQAEVKSKTERLASVDASYARLRQENTAQSRNLAELAKIAGELQEIHRRREVLMGNISRRYRELTDQYRQLAGTFEARRDAEGVGPAIAGADFSRIQNTIGLVEDDLRQINALNAQMQQAQKKLAAVKP